MFNKLNFLNQKGVGKSFLINCIVQYINFKYKDSYNPDEILVAVLAPTGK